MTHMLLAPEAMAAGAADVARIRSVIVDAGTAAASVTTGVLAPAGDEVSAAAATLFTACAREYHAVLEQAVAFQGRFADVLAAADDAYTQTEVASAAALVASEGPRAGAVVAVSLIMGGTSPSGSAPSSAFAQEIYDDYVKPHFTTTNVQGLTTTGLFYPATGVKSPTLDVSVHQSVLTLDNAIQRQLTLGTPVSVFGVSQSAVVASLEMTNLANAHVPPGDVTFVLVDNPMNPNGGMLSRFPGLSFPSLGLTFYGATPANTGYQTYSYAFEYDFASDTPRYPINVLADLNSFAGFALYHNYYPNPSALPPGSELVTLPTSQGYSGGTTYYMITSPNLPLLAPLRLIPYVGNPLADLLQPDLKCLVNWGYGNPDYGWSTGPADVATPFGFLPPLSDTIALGPALVSGTQQGIADAYGDFNGTGPHPVTLPHLSLSGLAHPLTAPPAGTSVASVVDGIVTRFEASNATVADSFSAALSTAYATLLPTADITVAVAVSLPSYDINLVLDGITEMVNGQPLVGLIDAIGLPIAADLFLIPLLVGFEGIVLLQPLITLFTGIEFPGG
ncbi:MAG: PE-PPE domain-containing protein [Mycobacterium sp.]